MSWECRKADGPAYFYLSRRVGGKVVKTYVGRGPEAHALSALLAEYRAGREAARATERGAVRAAQAVTAGADGSTAELDAAASVLAEATLLAAGFHRPNFGPWRRRRDGSGDRPTRAGGAGRDSGGRARGEGG